jgi:hypothetical protein
MFLSILMLLSLSVYAQLNEVPESNHDLRRGKTIVSMQRLKDKESLRLEAMNSGDYYMAVGASSSEEMKKISRPEAEGLEQKFASMMFKVQFELPQDPENCEPSWVLVMHGEKLNVCEKNDQKNQEIDQFFANLKSFK